LDPIERKYVEEFNTSNFVAIKKNTYVTPLSATILPSVTNLSLFQIAQDIGFKAERRKVDFADEVESFEEVGAVGTAVVVTPITSITHGERRHEFKSMEKLMRLREKMLSIQFGEEEDKHKWMREIQV